MNGTSHTSTSTDIPDRVARGTALLDRERPGWDQRISLSLLNITSGRDCVLGQEYGGYSLGAVSLFGPEYADDMPEHDISFVEAHGFHGIPGLNEWDDLAAEWHRIIEARRTSIAVDGLR